MFSCEGASLREKLSLLVADYAAAHAEHEQVEPPVFSRSGGAFPEDFSVSISCPTEGAEVFYTIDGINPDCTCSCYADPVCISGDGTSIRLSAVGVKEGMLDSDVVSEEYVIDYSLGVQLSLVLSTNGGGIITSPGEGAADVACGGTISLTASPDTGNGKYFGKWEVVSGTGVSLSDPFSVNTDVTLTDEDAEVRAVFLPAEISVRDTSGECRDVSVSGIFAYLADLSEGLSAVDISDPGSPALVDTISLSGNVIGVDISGDYAVTAKQFGGISVVDCENPFFLYLVGSELSSGLGCGVTVAGNFAYLSAYDYGIEIYDISDPVMPELAGTYDTPGNALASTVYGNFLFIADYNNGIEVIDVADPAFPLFMDHLSLSGNTYDIDISGNYAYAACSYDGMAVADISDPLNCVFVSNLSTSGDVRSVAVSGNYAYIAEGMPGVLRVIDISDPCFPSEIGYHDLPDSGFAVEIDGPYAYTACGSAGLSIIQVLP